MSPLPPDRPQLIAVMGPTATGKTDLAERLAKKLEARLISADAFQVYRGFDIGTAKPLDPQRYDLIDILEPSETFGVGDFIQRSLALLCPAYEAGQNAVIVGGTAYYVRALLEEFRELHGQPDPDLRESIRLRLESEGLTALVSELKELDPELAAKTDCLNPARVTRALERTCDTRPPIQFSLPPFRVLKIGLDPDVHQSRSRIVARVDRMMQNGWVAEALRLRKQGVSQSDPAMRAIGYGALWRHCDGEISLEETVELVVNETAQYAKRQRTWLRKEPRIERFAGFGDTEEAFGFALDRLN